MANRSGGMLGGGSGGKKKKRSASEDYKRSLMNEKQLDNARMEDIFKDEFDKLCKAATKAKPGQKEKPELGDNTKAAFEMIARRQAKSKFKQVKKEELAALEVKIDAKMLSGMQGGRIDKNGYVYDAANQHILTIDKKTGKIKNKWGSTVGKYKSGSPYSDHKLNSLVDKYDSRKQKAFGLGSGTTGHGMADGGIWSSGGSIWGNNDDTSGGGGFWG